MIARSLDFDVFGSVKEMGVDTCHTAFDQALLENSTFSFPFSEGVDAVYVSRLLTHVELQFLFAVELPSLTSCS